MQAVVLDSFSVPTVLRTIARPKAGANEVLVRIVASGVNPLDTKILVGKAPHANTQLPAILGIDMAGVVEEVGAGVTTFKRGDEVYGMSGGIGAVPGSLAEYAAVDVDFLARKPANMSMREAAAVPLIFITAWEGLVDRVHVGAGDSVLVHGGAGGVGHMAIQIARALGAKVFATGSGGQKEVIESFGATAIDYTNTTVDQYVEQHSAGLGFDAVYDTVGGATLDASFRAARKYGGHVVSCLGWGTHALAPLSFRAATYSGVFTLMPLLTGQGRAAHGAILREATRLIEAGKVKVMLDGARYTLATASDAHAAQDAGKANGKLVIDVG
jgi:NADPH:quinone reductase-like Zn-dependent oxidoreductase